MLKIYRVMKIFPQTMSQSVNELISNGGDCRTAPATPGLLNTRIYMLCIFGPNCESERFYFVLIKQFILDHILNKGKGMHNISR